MPDFSPSWRSAPPSWLVLLAVVGLSAANTRVLREYPRGVLFRLGRLRPLRPRRSRTCPPSATPCAGSWSGPGSPAQATPAQATPAQATTVRATAWRRWPARTFRRGATSSPMMTKVDPDDQVMWPSLVQPSLEPLHCEDTPAL